MNNELKLEKEDFDFFLRIATDDNVEDVATFMRGAVNGFFGENINWDAFAAEAKLTGGPAFSATFGMGHNLGDDLALMGTGTAEALYYYEKAECEK